MKTFFMLLAVLGLVAGCATQSPDVTTYQDKFSGLTTDLMENELPSTAQPREVVWLNAYHVARTYKKVETYLQVRYLALVDVGYLEIAPGQSLTIIADGQTFNFEGSGSVNSRKKYQKNFVEESALYKATPEQLKKIANAKKVHVRIRGSNGLIERDFQTANFERFREFVNRAAR